MTPTITTEDREAAEKYLVKRFPSYENDKSVMHIDVEVFNAGITHARSQPDSEFQKGVASVQSQLTGARERLDRIVKYCEPHTDFMWAASIVGIALDCDFRDAKQKMGSVSDSPNPCEVHQQHGVGIKNGEAD